MENNNKEIIYMNKPIKILQYLSESNSDFNKRKDASVKLKEKWKDPDFINKMNKRKPRSSDGSKLKEKWKDPVWRAYMLNQRKIKGKLKNETK